MCEHGLVFTCTYVEATAYTMLLVSYRHFTLQTFNDGANGTEIVSVIGCGCYVLYMSPKPEVFWACRVCLSVKLPQALCYFRYIVEYLFNHTH